MNARIVAVFGNLVIAETNGRVVQNSLAYCLRSDGVRLMSEVIRIRGRLADLQVFEETRGLRVGDTVELREEMLSVVLGPGLGLARVVLGPAAPAVRVMPVAFQVVARLVGSAAPGVSLPEEAKVLGSLLDPRLPRILKQ